MNECQDFERRMAEWAMGELHGAQRARFEEHLRSCASCRREEQRYAATWSLLGRHPQLKAEASFTESVVNRAREEGSASIHHLASHRRHRGKRIARWIALGGAVAAAVLLAALLFTPGDGEGEDGASVDANLVHAAPPAELLENLEILEHMDLLSAESELGAILDLESLDLLDQLHESEEEIYQGG